MEQELSIRKAGPEDTDSIRDLILTHGPNEWNYLPEDDVIEHVEGICDGEVFAVVADMRGQIVGVVTYEIGIHYPQYQPDGRQDEAQGYISEAVVHSDHVGRGIGSKLCSEAVEDMFAIGTKEIYAKRHEENEASAGMMRKSGFREVDTFPDPSIRPTGSRRTTVTRLMRDE